MRRVVRLALLAIAAVVASFLLLVRVSVVLYARGWPTWGAIGAGIGTAAVLAAVVGWVVLRRFSRRLRWRSVLLWGALPATLGFAGQGLMSLAAERAKTPAERADWRRTHPLLRLATATLAAADGDLVVTDLARTVDDYRAWGLAALETSQHLMQPDGYAHALDLRTAGRGAIRNALVQGWFRGVGLRTLRHVGTADHLHVGLPPRH